MGWGMRHAPLAQHHRLTRAQDATGGGLRGQAGQFVGHKMRGQIGGLTVGQFLHRHWTGMQAFAGRAFGKDDLVVIKHQVMIADTLALIQRGDPRQTDQILGRDQHLFLAKQHFAIGALDQQKMLGRDAQIGKPFVKSR